MEFKAEIKGTIKEVKVSKKDLMTITVTYNENGDTFKCIANNELAKRIKGKELVGMQVGVRGTISKKQSYVLNIDKMFDRTNCK